MSHAIQHPENHGKVATFDTYQEAYDAQRLCYDNHMLNHNTSASYTAHTIEFCMPMERLDGKWDIFICHHTDATEATNISDYDPSNYNQE